MSKPLAFLNKKSPQYFENVSRLFRVAGLDLIPVIFRNSAQVLCSEPTIETKAFFASLIGLKISGYHRKMKMNILPVDQSDFIADHVSLCERSGKQLIPHFSFKTISLSRCEEYNMEFPLLSMLRHSDRPGTADQLEPIIKQKKPNVERVYYNGSATVSKTLATHQILGPHIKSIVSAMFNGFHAQNNTSVIYSLATLPPQMDVLMRAYGFKLIPELFSAGDPGILHFGQFDGIAAIPMVLNSNEFSKAAKACVLDHTEFWNKLVIIEHDDRALIQEAA